MDDLILGIDLGDETTRVSLYRPDNMEPADLSFPQAEGRKEIQSSVARTGENGPWLIGKEAYESVLDGGGELCDRLGSKPQKDARKAFFGCILHTAGYEGDRTGLQVAVSVRKYVPELLQAIREALNELGIPEEKQHLISRSEAFMH